jgi:hypothetical protein
MVKNALTVTRFRTAHGRITKAKDIGRIAEFVIPAFRCRLPAGH